MSQTKKRKNTRMSWTSLDPNNIFIILADFCFLLVSLFSSSRTTNTSSHIISSTTTIIVLVVLPSSVYQVPKSTANTSTSIGMKRKNVAFAWASLSARWDKTIVEWREQIHFPIMCNFYLLCSRRVSSVDPIQHIWTIQIWKYTLHKDVRL